jgi:PAS domain S-box-containing protein
MPQTWGTTAESIPDLIRHIIDSTPALIHTAAPDGGIDFFNQTWLQYVGLPLEKLQGWEWTAAVHPADVEGIVERWRASLASGDPFLYEARVRRADGQYRWMLHHKIALRDEHGRIVKWYGSSIDIEDRKRAEEELRKSEERWRWMADAIPEVIWFTALKPEKVLYVSPSFERIWGLPVEDLYQNPRLWAETILPEDRDRVSEAYEQWIAGEDVAYSDIEYRIMLPHGDIRWIHDRGVLRFDEQGKPFLASGISTDITERKRAEEALHEMQMELAHVTRVATTGEITASIAHEMSQPLTAVMTNASASLRWLSGDQPNLTEGREALVRIVRDVGRAIEVIGRIRALLKNTPPQMGRLSINELIQDVLILTRTELVRRSVSLRTDLAEDLPVLLGDRVQLQQVILNLILNGIEALREAPNETQEILVASKFHESNEVLVLVRDSGVGIPPDRLEKIFTPFFTTKTQGLGMGLSISRSIIEAHSGRMWATVNPDRGMTVQFTLPMGAT